MDMQGERVIAADRASVWRALNDPEVLKACIPGCEELEKTSPTSFEGQVTQKVGPVTAKFKGAIELSDIVEGESYRIDGEGKGGAAGFAKGGANVRLDEVEGGTRLSYDVEAKVGGKLAQLGSRLIDGFARKQADAFFDRFSEEVGGPAPDEAAAEPAPEADSGEASMDGGNAAPAGSEAREPDRPSSQQKGWFGRLIGKLLGR